MLITCMNVFIWINIVNWINPYTQNLLKSNHFIWFRWYDFNQVCHNCGKIPSRAKQLNSSELTHKPRVREPNLNWLSCALSLYGTTDNKSINQFNENASSMSVAAHELSLWSTLRALSVVCSTAWEIKLIVSEAQTYPINWLTPSWNVQFEFQICQHTYFTHHPFHSPLWRNTFDAVFLWVLFFVVTAVFAVAVWFLLCIVVER